MVTPSPDLYNNNKEFGKVGVKFTIGKNVRRSGLKYDNMHNYYLDQ